MKEMVRYGFTLAVICIVASGLLAGVNVLTKSRISAQAQAEEDASLKEVFPEAAYFEAIKSGDEIIYYQALDKEKRLLGAAFRASGKGYSSTIETIAGLLKDGTIKAIKVLSQNETPGLGARVADLEFTSQFNNKQGLDDIQAVTGATISSSAVINSVKEKAEKVKALLSQERK